MGSGRGRYFSNLRYQPLPERKPLPSLPPFQRAGFFPIGNCPRV